MSVGEPWSPAHLPGAVRVDALWTGERFTGPTVLLLADGWLRPVEPERASAPGGQARSDVFALGGTLVPSLTDHHTHLGLSDPSALFRGGITHAVDLGWIPSVAATWLEDAPDRPAIAIAGALLTAPGGYPVNAGWAPSGAAEEIGGPREAREAVRRQVMTGASRIKVALNTDAGRTVDDATLNAIVEESHATGLPVIAHVQGVGQATRALRAGVDRLAHTPFSERLDDAVVAAAVESGMSWISTLDIHGWGTPTAGYHTAVDNLRRFAARGGRVHYGTDLGNGDLPVGVNARELRALQEAGLEGANLLRTIAGGSSSDGSVDPARTAAPIGPRVAWIPTPPPSDRTRLPGWLATARGLHVSELASTPPAPADLREEHP